MSSLKKTGSTSQWRRLREIVLRRDQHTCQLCGQQATHVDHIVPRRLMSDNIVDDLSNLQALCKQCNLRKGGGFFVSERTPLTPHDSFTPENAQISHYQDDLD